MQQRGLYCAGREYEILDLCDDNLQLSIDIFAVNLAGQRRWCPVADFQTSRRSGGRRGVH